MRYVSRLSFPQISTVDLLEVILEQPLAGTPLQTWFEQSPTLWHLLERLESAQGLGFPCAAGKKKLQAVFQLAQRLYMGRRGLEIRSADEAYALFADMALGAVERVEAAFLTTQNELIDRREIFLGDLSGAFARPRELLREALLANAAKMLVAHNHPSQCPDPSPEDEQFTAQLQRACEDLGVILVDHLIICRGGVYYSFRSGVRHEKARQIELPIGLSSRPPGFP